MLLLELWSREGRKRVKMDQINGGVQTGVPLGRLQFIEVKMDQINGGEFKRAHL